MLLAGQVLAAVFALATGGGVAGPAERPATRQLVVCLSAPADQDIVEATRLATAIFDKIDVSVRWERRPEACPAGGVRLSFWRKTPLSVSPGAFGRAFPLEGIRADVFLDRVRSAVPASYRPFVLGHVLAHELAHLAQAERRHAGQGLMQVRWAQDEVSQMPWSPLRFTAEDIALIHAGLERRAARFAFPDNPE